MSSTTASNSIATNSINAIVPTTGDISIGLSQVSGALNLGCAGNEAITGRTTGAINIGTDSGQTAIIKIGNQSTITPVQIRGSLEVSRATTLNTSLSVATALTVANAVGSTSNINILNGGGATTGGNVNIANGASQTTNVTIGSTTGTGTVYIDSNSTKNSDADPAIRIGTSTSTKTIKIGGTNSGVNINSFRFVGANLNNILNTADISIGNDQSTGALYIGAGSGVARTGAIAIATAPSTNCQINMLTGNTTAGSINLATGTGLTQTTAVSISSGSTNGLLTLGNPSNITSILSGTVNLKSGTGVSGTPIGGIVNIGTATGAGFVTTAVDIATGDTNGFTSIGNPLNILRIKSGTTNINTGVGNITTPLAGIVNIATGTGATFVTTTTNIATGDTTGAVTIGNSATTIALDAPTTVKSIKQNINYSTTQSVTITVAQILASNLFASTYSLANPTVTANDLITVTLPTPTVAMEGMTLTFRKLRGVLNTTTNNYTFICSTTSFVVTSLTTTASPTVTTFSSFNTLIKLTVFAYSGTYYYFLV